MDAGGDACRLDVGDDCGCVDDEQRLLCHLHPDDGIKVSRLCYPTLRLRPRMGRPKNQLV